MHSNYCFFDVLPLVGKAIFMVENMRIKAQLMDEGGVRRALVRISHEILERNKGAEDICIIGIRRRGELIAKRIADNIKQIEGVDVPCGDLDIGF